MNKNWRAGNYQEKKWPKVLKMTALKGKAIRQKRRMLLNKKISVLEKLLEKLKIQRCEAASESEKLKYEKRLNLKLKELSQMLIEKDGMGTI